MPDDASWGKDFRFPCFRCGSTAEPREKMLYVSVCIENRREDGSVDSVDEYTISQLCLRCAAVILTQAVLDKQLIMPNPLAQGINE